MGLISAYTDSLYCRIANPTLEALKDNRPAILLSSKSNSTVLTCSRGFHTWRKWASQFDEVKLFPAKDMFVALFLTSMIQESESFNKVNQVYYLARRSLCEIINSTTKASSAEYSASRRFSRRLKMNADFALRPGRAKCRQARKQIRPGWPPPGLLSSYFKQERVRGDMWSFCTRPRK